MVQSNLRTNPIFAKLPNKIYDLITAGQLQIIYLLPVPPQKDGRSSFLSCVALTDASLILFYAFPALVSEMML